MKGILYEQAASFARQLWRYRWLSVALAWLICAAGWPVISLIAPKYESSARVYVNADQLLTPLLHGVAVDDNPVRHVEYLQRTLLSRPNLEQVIHLSDLDLTSGPAPSDKEDLIQSLARGVELKLQTANLITITYRNENPKAAKNVVQALLTVFSENSAGGDRKEMENAKRFLDQQIQAYETQLRAAERRRADFHQKYMDLLPGLDGAVSHVEAGRAAVTKLTLDVADTRSKRDSLKRELETVPKFLTVDAAGPLILGRAVGARAQLEEARAKLAELRLRFTEQHPDVIALKQQITELEARVAREASTPTDGADSGGRKTQIANPLYEQVKIRLVEAETELASLERRLKQAQEEQAALEEKAQATPGVQAQAQDLDRDYEVKKRQYDEFLQRREQTLTAEAADNTADKIQFRIIDPPQVPVVPVAPNQPLLLSIVLLIAISAAIAAPLVLLQFDRSFSTVTALRDLGFPVLGSVSPLAFPGRRRHNHIQIAAVCATAGVLLTLYGVLLSISINTFGLGIA